MLPPGYKMTLARVTFFIFILYTLESFFSCTCYGHVCLFCVDLLCRLYLFLFRCAVLDRVFSYLFYFCFCVSLFLFVFIMCLATCSLSFLSSLFFSLYFLCTLPLCTYLFSPCTRSLYVLSIPFIFVFLMYSFSLYFLLIFSLY